MTKNHKSSAFIKGEINMETTDRDVSDWFESAIAGDEFTYKEGPALVLEGGPLGSRKVSTGSIEVRKLYDAGMVDLVQQRLTPPGFKSNDSSFAYIAVKRASITPITKERTFAYIGLTSQP